jgi:hypothetical protein
MAHFNFWGIAMGWATRSIAAAILAGVAVFFATASATAATVADTSTLDLSVVGLTNNGKELDACCNGQGFGSYSNVTLSPGDQFDFTINFSPGQELTIEKLSVVVIGVWSTKSIPYFNATGQIFFLDSTGSTVFESKIKTSTQGSDTYFQGFFDDTLTDFPGLPPSLTFSGIHYVGTLNSFGDPTITSRDYRIPFLDIAGESASISYGSTSPAPEPSLWAVFMIGVGCVGGAVRARRNQVMAVA